MPPRLGPGRADELDAHRAHREVDPPLQDPTKQGETEPVARYYRLQPTGLCNTLRAGSGSERGAFTSPRPLHPTLPRVLSNREAARLHSFPDWFRLHATKWHGFRQVGNAVAPLVGRAVGKEIVGALKLDPPVPTEPLALGDPACSGSASPKRPRISAPTGRPCRNRGPAARSRWVRPPARQPIAA